MTIELSMYTSMRNRRPIITWLSHLCEIFKSLFKSTMLSLKRYYAMLSQVVLFANKTKLSILTRKRGTKILFKVFIL